MEYTRLGSSGLVISKIVVGCMGFGDPSRGHHAWSLDLEHSRPLIRQALEAGVTTFDTANVYAYGSSEEILGQVLGELARRDEVVIATKVHGRMADGPNGAGLSRGAIMTQVDASLRRLRTDYIDLYQIHRFDPDTPVEETMEALHDLVRAGKVRYLGASSMWTWQFAAMQHAADLGGWTRFVAMQNHYNLLMREEEREMLPYCLDQNIGVIPWSPLARGRLARGWDTTTDRSGTDRFGATLYRQSQDADRQIVEAVGKIASPRGLSRAVVALAWVLSKAAVTAPIVGVTKDHHLTDALAALDLTLTDEETAMLEEHYIPHVPEGF
ncbi:aldo/keto reductase [Asanoa sp. WMMD1127]|uniref:aldo/keto reductase n=1 Tax=Asanoa sp. WMMD1127 TaxID=3016107 RepID=UPI0024181194|nr:aldo/keto reductase [Asanoa sp. WMMD1127]MDG4826363.1 aldo/keto reductase [Asanoa sp. WMMD1127]